MSATNLLRLAENNALRLNQAPELAFALNSQEGSDSDSESSGLVPKESDSFLENSDKHGPSGNGFYRGKGKNPKPGSKGIKGFFKNKKTLGFILAISVMVGGGGFLMFSNLPLLPAFANLVTEATDVQYAGTARRTTRIMQYMLEGGSATDTTWYGAKKYRVMSKSFKTKLANAGITVEGSGSSRVLKWNGETITASDFFNKYHTDVEFRNAYHTARQTRARVHYDKPATEYNNKRNLGNKLANHKDTGDNETNQKNFNEAANKGYDNNTTDLSSGGKVEETVNDQDADGNPILNEDGTNKTHTEVKNDIGTGTSSTSADTATSKQKATDFVNSATSKISTATSILDNTCAILKVGTLISSAVSVIEVTTAINYFSTYYESASKTIAGYGEEAGPNVTANKLTMPVTTTVPNLNDVQVSGSSDNITTSASEQTYTASPLQAPPLQNMMADIPYSVEEMRNFAVDRIASSLARTFGLAADIYTTCALAQIGSSAVSLAVTLGTGGIAKVIGSFFVSTVISAATNIAISGMISFIIPTVARVLFDNALEILEGFPAGVEIGIGAANKGYQMAQQASAYMPASTENNNAYYRIHKEVLALDAEVDRLNRSPFDITSKNTFLGSIAHSMLPLLTSSNLKSSTSILTHTAKTSLASITGINNVYADGENESYTTTYNTECANNDSDIARDMTCSVITSEDSGTLDIPPDDPTYQKVIANVTECDKNGNCTIKKNSELAKFINYCIDRPSPWGILDATILDSETEIASGRGGLILNSLPIVSDVVGIIEGARQLDEEAQDWANGNTCTDSSDNPRWNSEIKYYQRYVADMRILDDLGALSEGNESSDIPTNPVTAYREEYYKEHPLDNSPAGYLARISGSRKEDAEDALAVIDYLYLIENYDSSTRLAFGEINPTSTDIIDEANSSKPWQYQEKLQNPNHQIAQIILSNPFSYADIRNRSYAA